MSLDDINIDEWDAPAPKQKAPQEDTAPKGKRDTARQRQPRAPKQTIDPGMIIQQVMDAFNEIDDVEVVSAIMGAVGASYPLTGYKTAKRVLKRNPGKSLESSMVKFTTWVIKQLFKQHLEKRLKGETENE
jgi:hypothetical protein